jgi:hypothetical protein
MKPPKIVYVVVTDEVYGLSYWNNKLEAAAELRQNSDPKAYIVEYIPRKKAGK